MKKNYTIFINDNHVQKHFHLQSHLSASFIATILHVRYFSRDGLTGLWRTVNETKELPFVVCTVLSVGTDILPEAQIKDYAITLDLHHSMPRLKLKNDTASFEYMYHPMFNMKEHLNYLSFCEPDVSQAFLNHFSLDKTVPIETAFTMADDISKGYAARFSLKPIIQFLTHQSLIEHKHILVKSIEGATQYISAYRGTSPYPLEVVYVYTEVGKQSAFNRLDIYLRVIGRGSGQPFHIGFDVDAYKKGQPYPSQALYINRRPAGTTEALEQIKHTVHSHHVAYQLKRHL